MAQIDTPFQPLNDRQLIAIIGDSHGGRSDYLDVLSILHDILCEFTRQPQRAVLFHLHPLRDKYDDQFQPIAVRLTRLDPTIAQTARSNLDTALALARVFRTERQVPGHLVDLASRFMDAVLLEYHRIR